MSFRNGFKSFVCALPLVGCAVTPDIPKGATEFNADKIPQIHFRECLGLGNCPTQFTNKTYLPNENEKGAEFISTALLAPIAASLVTQGVDLIGSKLSNAAEEKTRSIEAKKNFSGNLPIGTFRLTRDDIEVEVLLAPITGYKDKKPHITGYDFLEMKVVALNYGTSVDYKKKGTRGLTVTLDLLHAGEADTISRSVVLGNVEVGSSFSLTYDKSYFTSDYFPNPFARRTTQKERTEGEHANKIYVVRPPFTMTLRLTEVRNANELAQFAADSFESANNSITTGLLDALNLPDGAQAAPVTPAAGQGVTTGIPAGSGAPTQPPQ